VQFSSGTRRLSQGDDIDIGTRRGVSHTPASRIGRD